jgi:hypothetical protein
MNKVLKYQLLAIFFLGMVWLPESITAQKKPVGNLADKPLFRDPVFDGAADPAVIWNKKEKKWFMFYTNRRANAPGLDGVSWVHGTLIGIAESADGGATWKYRDTCDIQYRFTDYTHMLRRLLKTMGCTTCIFHMCPGSLPTGTIPAGSSILQVKI